MYWKNSEVLPSYSYTCGYCGSSVASNRGYRATYDVGHTVDVGRLYVCHKCECPTFVDSEERQSPGCPFGERVADTEKSVGSLYDEARRTYSVSSFTAAVLCCRKLLMHVAVSQGAKPGESFISYVEYLANNSYVPPGAKPWVDHIRTKGNEANHDSSIMGKDDAEDLLRFSEMLLKLVYEYPAAVAKKFPKKS